MQTLSKILVIRFSSIGDIILATPLLRILRTKFPKAQIDFVIRKEYVDLLKHNSNLNIVYEFDVKKGFKGLYELRRMLLKNNYDLIIDIHNNLRSRFLRLFCHSKKVVVNKRIIARTLLVLFKINIYKEIIPVSKRYIETLIEYKVSDDERGLELVIPESIRSETNAIIESLNIYDNENALAFCPSAKHFTKCWLPEYYIELGKKLQRDGFRILIFGSSSDFFLCKSIAEGINTNSNGPKAINLSGKFTLLQTAAALTRCESVVTNDTGLMHMANALNKKVFAIFGPTVKEFGFFPIEKNCFVIENKNLNCRPCSHLGGKKCPKHHFKCMREIKPEKVYEMIKTPVIVR